MGGFHSIHISRYYPNTFDFVGLFSAAILPNQDVSSRVYQDINGTLKEQMENGYELYWIGIGKTGPNGDALCFSRKRWRAHLEELEDLSFRVCTASF